MPRRSGQFEKFTLPFSKLKLGFWVIGALLFFSTADLLKKVRLEIAVNIDFVQPTIDAIVKGARTDNIGDGKIFVLPLERCIRIRTGEEGSDAIG